MKIHWFKHDTDAFQDAKLKRLRIKYGMQGYGLYWYCIELITSNISESNITFELEHDAELISHDTGIHYELVEEMMQYMVNAKLFENSNGTITCFKLAKRLNQSMTSNPQMRNLIKEINKRHDGIMISHDDVSPDKIDKIDKIDEIDEKPVKFNFKSSLIAMGVDKDVASDWLKVRSKKQAANTHTALNAIVKQIALTNMTANEVITLATESSWVGFKASWIDKPKKSEWAQ